MSLSQELGGHCLLPCNTSIEVQCIAVPMQYVHPVLVHRGLCKRFGREEVFLNEAFSREDRSHQNATVGFGRLLAVLVAAGLQLRNRV
jgi:hypothetical protein